MARMFLTVLTVLCAAAVQASTVDDTYYVAAVVDYSPPVMANAPAEQIIMKNIEALGDFMARAAKENVDIIVFPEDGLKGLSLMAPFPMAVPGPEDDATPCANNDMAMPLRELSCLAAKHGMYLVVNLVQRVECTRAADAKCPARGFYNYNTNVVFDRRGKIVARYHKYNLFGEPNNNVPPTVELSTFDTDFGVRFGTFICFDILFDAPAAELVRKHNITDFVYSAAWFSEVPFLSAVQAHSGWAHALDVTVLAAGLNYPPAGSTGSGIYRGRHGILAATFNPRTESTLSVRRVPKRGHWDDALPPPQPAVDRLDPVLNYAVGNADPYNEVKALRMIQDNMTMYSTQLLPRPDVGAEHIVEDTLCNDNNNKELCCRFRIRVQGAKLFQMSSAAVSLHGGYSRRGDAPADRVATPTRAHFNKAQAENDFDGFHYRMVAFSGVRDHSGVATTGVQVCGVVSCLNEELESCGWTAPGLGSPAVHWTEFLSLHIEAEYEKRGTLQFASTMAGPRYEQLPANVYTLDRVASAENEHTVSLTLEKSMLDLRTFAIYGRYFAWDGQMPSGR